MKTRTNTKTPSRVFSELELEFLLCKMITPLGLQASGSEHFKSAVFGRDSLLSLLFLLGTEQDYSWLSDLVLTSQAKMRGIENNARREEEPGKFAHELRVRSAPGMNLEIFEHLKDVFGEYTKDSVVTWPTVDATPLAIIAAYRHSKKWGSALFDKQVGHTNPDVQPISLREALLEGISWMVRKIEESDLGLLEYARRNPEGIEFHVLEDGKTSYRRMDGSYPNLKEPIAYLTTQGQAHEALLCAAKLFPEHKNAPYWMELAKKIQDVVLDRFWLEDEKNFACALDRDPQTKQIRQIKTFTTVQVSILDSTIFDSLAEEKRRYYVENVLRKFFTSEFITEVGPRSFALSYDELTPYYSYQGTRVSWPILTHRSARGCRRQGYHALATDLDTRMINGVQTAGKMRELLYVSPEGKVIYDPECEYSDEKDTEEIYATNIGEATQTWTIASMLEAKHYLAKPYEITPFENSLLEGGPTRLLAEKELEEKFEKRYRARINCEKGVEMEKELAEQLKV